MSEAEKFVDPQDRKFIDPSWFTPESYPIICLSDDLRSFVGWAIKHHTNGNYGHIFIMTKPGICVSQDFGGFKEKPMTNYLTPNQVLKFWRIKDLTPIEKIWIMRAIEKRMSRNWVHKLYDYVGVVGQFLRIKGLQNPWLAFCSEQVNYDYIRPVPRALKILDLYEPSPSGMDDAFKKHPELMECLGYWWDS